MSLDSKKILRHVVYLAGLFLNFHLALSAYINSSFLLNYASENTVGVIFSVASLGMIITLLILPYLLDKIGNMPITSKVTGALIVVSFLLATLPEPTLAIPLFIIYFILGFVLVFNIDLYLEHLTEDSESGSVRGTYYSLLNFAWFVSPIMAGLLLGTEVRYDKIYAVTGVILLPFLALTAVYLPEIKDHYRQFSFWQAIKRFLFSEKPTDLAVHRILVIEFLIQFFYGIMIIYAPIYLNKEIGFTWPEIGLMFSIMLIPFFFQFWFGKLADTKYGEKEMLIGAFLISAISSFVFAFTTEPNILIWTFILFTGRLGASCVEIMKESYLFKHIDADDVGVLVLSRNMRPLAYIISPLMGAIFITFFNFNYLFIFLGLILIWGMFYSFKLVDTR